MLVIPRNVGESVMIGDYLEIGIEEVTGDETRIWIRRIDDQPDIAINPSPLELIEQTALDSERIVVEDHLLQRALTAK